VNDTAHPPPATACDRLSDELGTLGHVEPPPALVARVMTQLAEPRLPSVWQWLRRPFSVEIRLSPLMLIGIALALAAAFVFIGATIQ
jgi:hypothetical protein